MNRFKRLLYRPFIRYTWCDLAFIFASGATLKYMAIPLTLATMLLSTSVFSQSEGTIVLSDTVTGNQEQPKVLYIVPWQAAQDDTMLKAELVTKLQSDVFSHVERPEHKRQLELITQLNKTDEAAQPK